MNEIINEEGLSGGGEFAPADTGASVSEAVELKDILSKELGKQFPTNEAALKAVKDTFSYVGRNREQVRAEVLAEVSQKNNVDMSNFVSKAEFDESNWYKDNPEYAPHKAIISSVQKAQGFASPADAINSDVLKETLGQLKEYNSIQKSKSVLHSNPRLGQVTDKMTQAKESLKQGDFETARNSAVVAAMQAFEK